MRRTFLKGVLAGVVLALLATTFAQFVIDDKVEPTYLRVADDNFDLTESGTTEPEQGPFSVRLIRECGIGDFQVDLTIPDHTGSSYVQLEKTSSSQINCLIGKARANGLTLAVVQGFDTSEIECLAGNPRSFRKPDDMDGEILARCALYNKAAPVAADQSK